MPESDNPFIRRPVERPDQTPIPRGVPMSEAEVRARLLSEAQVVHRAPRPAAAPPPIVVSQEYLASLITGIPVPYGQNGQPLGISSGEPVRPPTISYKRAPLAIEQKRVAPQVASSEQGATLAQIQGHYQPDQSVYRTTATRAGNMLWAGGGKRKVATSAASIAILAALYFNVADTTPGQQFVALKDAFTPDDANPIVYPTPDCTKPLFNTDINSQAGLLQRMVVFANSGERAKVKADKNYKPALYSGFFEDQKTAQMLNLPETPFSKDKVLISRLPATIYAGNLGISVCFTGEAIQPVSGNPFEVKMDASKVSLGAIEGDSFKDSYERYPKKIRTGQENNSIYPDGELARQAKVLIPDPTNPQSLNDAIVNMAKLNALSVFDTGASCDDWITKQAKDTINGLLDKRAQHHVTVDWTGGFVTPTQTFKSTPSGKKAAGYKDAELVNVNTQACSDTSNSASGGTKT